MKTIFQKYIKTFVFILMNFCFIDSFGYVVCTGTVPTPGLDDLNRQDIWYGFKGTGLHSGTFYFIVDKVECNATMVQGYSTVKSGGLALATCKLDDKIVDIRDNREYILTGLGNNADPLVLKDIVITPNIRRIAPYAFAFENRWANYPAFSTYTDRYIDENTEFDYVGVGGLERISGGPLKIADNGELHSIDYTPNVIKLGKNVSLKSVDHIFCGFPSDSICELYSYSENPPQIETYTQIVRDGWSKLLAEPKAELFTSDDCYKVEHSTLYVPAGCKEAYSADPEWGRFENIVEMEPVALEEIIADEQQGISISTDLGQIYVSSTVDREVSVYAISGLLLKRDHTRDGGVSIELQPGAYLVKVGDKFIRKVAVK